MKVQAVVPVPKYELGQKVRFLIDHDEENINECVGSVSAIEITAKVNSLWHVFYIIEGLGSEDDVKVEESKVLNVELSGARVLSVHDVEEDGWYLLLEKSQSVVKGGSFIRFSHRYPGRTFFDVTGEEIHVPRSNRVIGPVPFPEPDLKITANTLKVKNASNKKIPKGAAVRCVEGYS